MTDQMGLRDDHVERPHPARLSPDAVGFDEIMERHRAAVARGELTYTDPATARSVFTSAFLAERGYCCESGCRHCPYVGAGAPT
jgi:hypothetical protein